MTNWTPFPHKVMISAGVINNPHLIMPGPDCPGGVRPHCQIIHNNIICHDCNEEVDAWAPDPQVLDDPEIASGFFEGAGVGGGGMNCYPGVPGGACYPVCAIHVDLTSDSLGAIIRRHLRSCGHLTRHFIIVGFSTSSLYNAVRSNLFNAIREMYELTHPGEFTFEFRIFDGTVVYL